MSEKTMSPKQGHWVLAKLGKRVLRPGGLELTNKMLDTLNVDVNDDVVEFAPGLGVTATKTLSRNPKSYTGVEMNEEVAGLLRKNLKHDNFQIINANAAETGLPDACATKVYGEAMLTMQSKVLKEKIVGEAARILKDGGLYGIHEIGLTENNQELEKDMARVIATNVRPLTEAEWRELLERNGLEPIAVFKNGMFILEPKRVIADEGFFRTLLIMFRALTHPELRRRALAMKSVFRKHKDNMYAISIISRKKCEK